MVQAIRDRITWPIRSVETTGGIKRNSTLRMRKEYYELKWGWQKTRRSRRSMKQAVEKISMEVTHDSA
jgi:hypothetical protein